MDIVQRVAGRLSAPSQFHRGAHAALMNRVREPHPSEPINNLRETLSPPGPGRLLHRFGDAIDTEALDLLLADIWQAVIAALQRPIKTGRRLQYRSVTFMDVLRYRIDRETGEVVGFERRRSGPGYVFRKNRDIPVDLPGATVERWIGLFLNPWWSQIEQTVLRDQLKFERFIDALAKEISRSVLKSVWWKNLRYALRKELGLDSDVLRWCRKGSHRVAQAAVTQDRYNRTVNCRPVYERLERENPNLIWVFNIALDDSVLLYMDTDAVAALKDAILRKRGTTPVCWRLLCRAKEQDFRFVVDWYDQRGGPQFRWYEIAEWLQFLSALRRRSPLPRKVIKSLFMHDPVAINRVEQTAQFRGVSMPLSILRVLLQEAERQHKTGQLRTFAGSELTDVVTWYGATRPNLDKNQVKQGFPYLARRAAEWKLEVQAAATLGTLKWDKGMEDVRIGPWTVVHLTDAFMLRQEAIRMRHCADRYTEECVDLETSIFSVRNDKGKQVATVGLKRYGTAWEVFGFRGFANQPVAPSLEGVDEEVCWYFQNYWHRTQLAGGKVGRGANQ